MRNVGESDYLKLSSKPPEQHLRHKVQTTMAASQASNLMSMFAVCCAAAVAVRGGGEGSGPLYPPSVITEDCFSAGYAAAAAYHEAGLTPADIHYWGLYDCFPICLIRWVPTAVLLLDLLDQLVTDPVGCGTACIMPNQVGACTAVLLPNLLDQVGNVPLYCFALCLISG